MANLVKVYSSEQMSDMGMDTWWQSSFHNHPLTPYCKEQLEVAARKIVENVGYGHNLTFGIKANPKSLRVYYKTNDPTAERIARVTVDRLLNAVRAQWMYDVGNGHRRWKENCELSALNV